MNTKVVSSEVYYKYYKQDCFEHSWIYPLVYAFSYSCGVLPRRIIWQRCGLYIWSSQVVLMVKNLTANVGDIKDVGSLPRSGRSSGRKHGNLIQYSCLDNPMDRGAWWAMAHRVTKSRPQLKPFSVHTCRLYTNVNFKWRLVILQTYCTHLHFQMPCFWILVMP